MHVTIYIIVLLNNIHIQNALCLQRRQWQMELSSDTAGFRIGAFSCDENQGSQLSLRNCDLSLEV